MENTFDLKKFLVENKLTNNSRILSESSVEGIDLNLVKDLQKDPAVQKLHKDFMNNPELAREAAKVLANIVDGSLSESINELHKAPQDYRFSPEEIKFAEKMGVVRSKYRDDQVYADMVYYANDTYNPAMTTGIYEKPTAEPAKKESFVKRILRSAGAGVALVGALAPFTYGTGALVGFSAAAAPAALTAILVGALLGIGIDALATDGFKDHVKEVEEVTNLAGEVQAIIDAGRKL